MREDQLAWDEKYREGIVALDGPPAPFLVDWLARLPRGRALDLAAGCGRHAVYLAQHGYRVDALDISPVGLARLVERARVHGVHVRAAAVDLDEIALPPGTYNLIVNMYYLNRRLLAQVPEALAPGGAVIVETPLYDPAGDSPDEVRHRPWPGELAQILANLDIAHYEESPVGYRRHWVCRLVAFRRRGSPGGGRAGLPVT